MQDVFGDIRYDRVSLIHHCEISLPFRLFRVITVCRTVSSLDAHNHTCVNSEVERERQSKQVNCTQDGSFIKELPWVGGIWTHDTLQSRRVLYQLRLYQLSYQGNSAGRGSNLQQIKANLKPLCSGSVCILSLSTLLLPPPSPGSATSLHTAKETHSDHGRSDHRLSEEGWGAWHLPQEGRGTRETVWVQRSTRPCRWQCQVRDLAGF